MELGAYCKLGLSIPFKIINKSCLDYISFVGSTINHKFDFIAQ